MILHMKNNKVVAVIQARMGSTRLPGKVLLDVEGKPVLIHIIERVLQSKAINQIVVATTTAAADSKIKKVVGQYFPHIAVYQGSENDLLDRCYQAVKDFNPTAMVRITSDSPLVDFKIIDQVVSVFLKNNADYASNALGVKKYPVGYELEVFSFKVLENLWREVKDPKEREFPSLFIREHLSDFRCQSIVSEKDHSSYRWTLDEPDDYAFMQAVYKELYQANSQFVIDDVLALLEEKPELIAINQHVEQKWKNY